MSQLTKFQKACISSPIKLLRDAKLNHIISNNDEMLHLAGIGILDLDDHLAESPFWDCYPDGSFYNVHLDLGLMVNQRGSYYTFVLPF